MLPSTGACSGLVEALALFRKPDFTKQRFERYWDVFDLALFGQRIVFISGGDAITDVQGQPESTEG